MRTSTWKSSKWLNWAKLYRVHTILTYSHTHFWFFHFQIRTIAPSGDFYMEGDDEWVRKGYYWFIFIIYIIIYIININIGYKLDYNNRRYITVQWCNDEKWRNEKCKCEGVRCEGKTNENTKSEYVSMWGSWRKNSMSFGKYSWSFEKFSWSFARNSWGISDEPWALCLWGPGLH